MGHCSVGDAGRDTNVIYLRFLDSLIGGNAFIIKVIIYKNGIAVNLRALMDIGA
jgi:hypothetical protein